MAQIDGTSGVDILVGTIAPDTIAGGAGYDLIMPGAGNDSIDGGDGVDILALTGRLGDYLVEEITAPTDTTPGTYRITDQRAGAPEGSDTFTGIEKLRFEIGGEVSLADALDRAPTDIDFAAPPRSGPEVIETASAAARSSRCCQASIPIPDETFTFTLSTTPTAASRSTATSWSSRRTMCSISSRTGLTPSRCASTDHAGNFFDRTAVVAVRDESTCSRPFRPSCRRTPPMSACGSSTAAASSSPGA